MYIELKLRDRHIIGCSEIKGVIMLSDYLKALPQYLIPQHALSRLCSTFANCQKTPIKNFSISRFIHHYSVDMEEAENSDPQSYASFNDFFIRKLKPSSRSLVEGDNHIASPIDGYVSQIGDIKQGQIFQAKGFHLSLHELLGGSLEYAEPFHDGKFATLYLAPANYHRVHMPLTGTLEKMMYIPGKLFSVSSYAARTIPKLFTRNERVVCLFETPVGKMAVVLIGAMIVASIHTLWHGDVTPAMERKIRQWGYPNSKTEAMTIERGAEMGYFKLGSTVIVLFEPHKIMWDDVIHADSYLRFGQKLGTCL